MAGDSVRLEREGAFALLTLNRPERRNALSLPMMLELEARLRELGEDRDVRAIVLRAEGPVFSSGHDLRELCGGHEQSYRAIFDACVALMLRVIRVPQPVIAEVGGMATAAGCQLVATCDLAICSERATFATPGVRIGLFCSTPMVALTRAIGRKRALEMLLTGEPIDAATALSYGLVNRVVPSERLHEATMALAAQIGRASERIIGIGKAAFYAQIEQPVEQAYAHARDVMVANALEADAQEGIGAFLGKRAPNWPSAAPKIP